MKQEQITDQPAAGAGCPYARGTDILKMHYLFMSRDTAVKMDEEIEKRRAPACGKPIHPGSCMCQEHMRFSHGYNLRALPYPRAGAAFTCQHSPDSFDSEKRWICHDKNGNFAGEFVDEKEAKEAVDAWNEKGGELVTLEWIAPPDDAADSNRGTYVIRLVGTAFVLRCGCGWHSDSMAGERLKHLRNAIAKYGFETVSEVLFAAQTHVTKHGWGTANNTPKANITA